MASITCFLNLKLWEIILFTLKSNCYLHIAIRFTVHMLGLYKPSFTYTVGTTLVIDCTQNVQPQFLPYLHSGPIHPHLMTQWAYTPSFTYKVGNTLAIYCTQTVQPQYLPYLHSGPIPPHLMTQWAYTPSFSYTVGTTLPI